MVVKLKLELLPHRKPYKLHWINDGGDNNVKNQVKVKFSVGNLIVLLGRP